MYFHRLGLDRELANPNTSPVYGIYAHVLKASRSPITFLATAPTGSVFLNIQLYFNQLILIIEIINVKSFKSLEFN